MANRERGVVELKVGDDVFRLRYTVNAICEIEDHLGIGVNAIVAKLANPAAATMKFIRAMVWGGLVDQHPDITVEQAGDIMTDYSLPDLQVKIAEALEAAFPDEDSVKNRARPKRQTPTRAQKN